jgi:predicted secreted Zn-dependent protease
MPALIRSVCHGAAQNQNKLHIDMVEYSVYSGTILTRSQSARGPTHGQLTTRQAIANLRLNVAVSSD